MYESSRSWRVAGTRASIARHRSAIYGALRAALGDREAERLMQDDDAFREPSPRDDAPSSSTERARILMATPQGRARLATLTWDSV